VRDPEVERFPVSYLTLHNSSASHDDMPGTVDVLFAKMTSQLNFGHALTGEGEKVPHFSPPAPKYWRPVKVLAATIEKKGSTSKRMYGMKFVGFGKA